MLDDELEDFGDGEGSGEGSGEGAEESGDENAEAGAEEEDEGGGSGGGAASFLPSGFFGSLKGIITAVTGLIVAIGGLITVLANSGVIGEGGSPEDGGDGAGQEIPGEPPAEPEVPIDLEPEADSDPAPAPDEAVETRMFVVVSRSDGWAAVRSQPTIGSTMLSRAETGTFLRCGRTIPDATDIPNRNWRYCPEVDGHIAANLLRRARD